jgi:hypothetical protein
MSKPTMLEYLNNPLSYVKKIETLAYIAEAKWIASAGLRL